MGKKTIYRTVITAIIVSTDPVASEEIRHSISETIGDLDDVDYYCTQTDIIIDNSELVGKNAVIEIEKHAQELEHFGIDAQGFEIEVDD